MRSVRDCKWLMVGMNAVFVAAVQLLLPFGVGHPNTPVRRLYDVEGRALVSELLRECQHVLVHVRFDPVIGLHDGNPRARSFGKSAVACGAVALVLFVDDLNALIRDRVALHDGQRVIGAAVVQQDDFEFPMRLPRDAVKTLLQIGACVVDRHDNRYKRFAHVRPFPLALFKAQSVGNLPN